MSDTTALREIAPWEKHHDTIFVDWADKAACYTWLHDESYNKYHIKRNWYTIPVIIMSTLTGTANFALERVPTEYQATCSIAIGSINILAGIITTIAQFLKLNELAESHRVASLAWDKFYRSIRVELIKSPEERMEVNYFMKTSRDEFDRLMETSPSIDKDIIIRFKNEMTKSKDKTEYARRIKNFNRLTKPEIFNEITTIKDIIYKSQPQIEITIQEQAQFKKITNERDNYKQNVERVRSFISSFQMKYSRYPSHDELLSNIKDVAAPDLKIILQEIQE
jgi:hypothetical protein